MAKMTKDELRWDAANIAADLSWHLRDLYTRGSGRKSLVGSTLTRTELMLKINDLRDQLDTAMERLESKHG